jgi:hypothetical protein
MVSFPRLYLMRPAFCRAPATRLTVGRRTPNIWAMNSWVSGNWSAPARLWVINSQRHRRFSAGCRRLQAVDCDTWINSAWV